MIHVFLHGLSFLRLKLAGMCSTAVQLVFAEWW
jgi:hypothetical protein